jgi:heptosyltransferase-2
VELSVVAAPKTEPAVAPEPRAAPAPAQESLVVQTSFLGDLVLTTPLIAELARRGPVDVVATPAAAPLLANNPSVREVIRYDKRGDETGLFGLFRAARSLRARATRDTGRRARRVPDVAYLAQGSVRSAMLALLAGVRERVGFDTSSGRALYTRRVPYRPELHHAERLWLLGAPDGARATAAQLRPRVFPGDADVSAVDALLADAGHASGETLVALAPGSIWPTKRWPYFPELAAALARRGRIVIVGSSADRELADVVVAAAGARRAIDATGRLTLLASAELIGRAAVLVTNDSAPQHLASAMGTATVTIFGPTVPEFGFGPLAPHSAAAGHPELDCRPCDRHGPRRCPLGHWRCMRELPVERIARLVDNVLPLTLS